MPLTQQIIENAIRKVVKFELIEVKTDLAEVKTELVSLHRKVDKLNDTVTDFAGQVDKFDQETTVLAHQIPDRTKRIEKLERSVFGHTA